MLLTETVYCSRLYGRCRSAPAPAYRSTANYKKKSLGISKPMPNAISSVLIISEHLKIIVSTCTSSLFNITYYLDYDKFLRLILKSILFSSLISFPVEGLKIGGCTRSFERISFATIPGKSGGTLGPPANQVPSALGISVLIIKRTSLQRSSKIPTGVWFGLPVARSYSRNWGLHC